MSQSQSPSKPNKPSIGNIIGSTFAAAIGVQKNTNRERDFQQGKLSHYVISGIIFTVLFIVTITSIVRYILA